MSYGQAVRASRTGKEEEEEEIVATKTRFGVIRAALVLPGSPNLEVPEGSSYEVSSHEISGVPLTFAGIGGTATAPQS